MSAETLTIIPGPSRLHSMDSPSPRKPTPLYEVFARNYPPLTMSIEALKAVREAFPDLTPIQEVDLLRYSVFVDHPHALAQIAEIFRTSKNNIRQSVDRTIDSLEEPYEVFETAREQQEEQQEEIRQRTFLVKHPHISIKDLLFTEAPKILGSIQTNLFYVSNQTPHTSDLAKQTGHTEHGARQQLYVARKRLEERIISPLGYEPIGRNDEELSLAAQLGKLEGAFFALGRWHANKDVITAYLDQVKIPSHMLHDAIEKPKRKKMESYCKKGMKILRNTIYDNPKNG